MSRLNRVPAIIISQRDRLGPLDLDRVAGYDIEIVPEGQAPTFSPPTLQVGAGTSADVPFAPGPDGSRYEAYVRARTAQGIAGPASKAQLRFTCEAGAVVVRPASPRIKSVESLADGAIRIRWDHQDDQGDVATASFAVYADDGRGSPVDYGVAVATAGPYERSATLAGLTAGLMYRLAVRAIGTNDQHDGGFERVTAVPRGTPPPAVTGLLAEQIEA